MQDEFGIGKRKQNEAKELERRKRELARKKPPFFIFYIVFLLALVYIIDEVASNIHANLLPEIANDINSGNTAIFYTMESVATFMLAISIFYKPLADRFGRKPFLFINTLGMGVSLFICLLARENSIFLYFVGFFLLRFFVTPDQQVVYIFEVTPKEKRARTYSLIKGVAELGLIAIPLLRRAIMGGDIFGEGLSEADSSLWRFVFLVPAIVAVVVSFLCLLFARETDAFLKQRIAYLEMSEEERERKRKTDGSSSQGGIIAGLKAIFTNKQLLFLVIVTFVYILGRFLSSSYADVLSKAFSLQGLTEAQVSSKITKTTFYFPFSCALFTMAYGFFSDKFGRKPTVILLLLLTAISYGLFAFGATASWHPVALGLLIGVFLGAYWGAGDTLIMMVGESAPTNLRATVMSLQGGFYGIGMIISLLVGSRILSLSGVGNENLNAVLYAFLGFALLAYILSAVLLWIFTKETKGTEVESVGFGNSEKAEEEKKQ